MVLVRECVWHHDEVNEPQPYPAAERVRVRMRVPLDADNDDNDNDNDNDTLAVRTGRELDKRQDTDEMDDNMADRCVMERAEGRDDRGIEVWRYGGMEGWKDGRMEGCAPS